VLYVLFPAYNEEAAIGSALRSLGKAMAGRGIPFLAVLIDDGSTDRTVDEAKKASAELGGGLPLEVLSHGDNRGLGAGLRTGIHWCLARGTDADVIVTLDADDTHPPKLIPMMLERIAEGYDLVIASRYQKGAIVHGVPPHRRLLSDGARLLFQTLFPFRGVRDYTCCFRAYRAPILRNAQTVYGDELLTARGFEAVMDLLLRLRQLDVRATEVPLELAYEKRVGRSKMRVLRTARRTLALLSRRRLESWGRYSKGRVRRRLAEAGRAGGGAP
jgi:dolichol-phosphate mannosyltransferase